MDDAITHVIRGDDHISNTPKQIQILARARSRAARVRARRRASSATDGKKLSKRHGAVSVDEFRDAGYLPEALVNFLALLGWAPDGETTIMSRDELVERFTLERGERQPGNVRLREARLDERRLPARAPPDGVRATRLVALPARAGRRLARGARPRGGAARAGEDRHGSASSPRFAGFLFGDVEPDPELLDERILRAGATMR